MRSIRWLVLALCGCCLLLRAGALLAADPKPGSETAPATPPRAKPNVPAVTFGGKQFWTDELLYRQWRIQYNVLTANYRLLDESDVRQAWGTFAECRARLDQIRRDQHLPPMRGRVVILLHGLGRTRSATHGMAQYLAKTGNLSTLEFGYASTRAEVADHAKSLARVIQNLPDVDEVDFVAHSLGNLVIRRYLEDVKEQSRSKPSGPRIGRIVMLGPPNNGAHMAQLLGDNKFVIALAGPPATELGPGWPELAKHLATPDGEFGIIAGSRADQKARNPLLQGGDDLVVAVSETKLPGASDFLVLPVIHSFMMDDPKVQEATLRFLDRGYFISAEQRSPIPK